MKKSGIKKIEQISPAALMINWDDGHESVWFADHLRKNCPCAICNKSNNSAKKEFKNIFIEKFEQMGRYALKIDFSDRHNAGIYTYEYLLNLCQCDLCSGKVVRIQGPFS
jgi:DUF971 family protein